MTFENFVYRINDPRLRNSLSGEFFEQASTLGQYIPFRVYRSPGTLPEGDFRYTTILAGNCCLQCRAANAQARAVIAPDGPNEMPVDNKTKTYGDDPPLYHHRSSACHQANVSAPHSGKKKNLEGGRYSAPKPTENPPIQRVSLKESGV